MIEKHLHNQLQRCFAKQDRESVIAPEHRTIERYFEKKIVYTSVSTEKKWLENTLVLTLMALMNRKNKSRIPCTLALADSRKYVSFRLILIQFYVAWASKLREIISILNRFVFLRLRIVHCQ